MLVVDRHALLAVHLLHLVAEVLLGLADALDLEDLLRVERGLVVAGELLAGHDLDAVGDAREEVRAAHDRVLLFGPVVGDDGEDPLALLVLADADDARALRP